MNTLFYTHFDSATPHKSTFFGFFVFFEKPYLHQSLLLINLLLQSYISEHLHSVKSVSDKSVTSPNSASHTDIQHPMEIAVGTSKEAEHDQKTDEMNKQRTITIEHVVKETKKGNDEAKRIIDLHKLIKQHTILVYIAQISSILWIISLYISQWMWLENVWIILINYLCIWLMFKNTYKYWKFMTNYCCCYICYCRKNRDIDSKTLCLFC